MGAEGVGIVGSDGAVGDEAAGAFSCKLLGEGAGLAGSGVAARILVQYMHKNMTELDPKKSAFILGSTLLAPFVFGGSWLLGYLTDQIGLYEQAGYVDTYNVFRPSAWPFSIAVISAYIVYVIILYRYRLKEKKSSNFSLLYAVTSLFTIAAVTLILKWVMYGTGHN